MCKVAGCRNSAVWEAIRDVDGAEWDYLDFPREVPESAIRPPGREPRPQAAAAVDADEKKLA
jgi:hypothetical protein